MADIKYYDVILKPVVTEKSMDAMGEKNTLPGSSGSKQTQIKEAVEKMFEGTKVKSVNTMNLDGKKKRRGMVVGKLLRPKSDCSADRRQQRYRNLRGSVTESE